MPTWKQCSALLVSILCSVLFQLHSNRHEVDSAPLIPILTAIATSAAGIFQIQVDTLHIAKYLREASNCKKNRASFVRDLLYTAFYRSGQTHNVIVFNLGEEHRQRLYGVLFYGSVAYPDGTRFGVWVFENGVFENKGARGWHNWGMIGTFKKSKNGETIYFQRRHKANVPETTVSANINNSTENNDNVTLSTTTAITTTSTTTLKPMDILGDFVPSDTSSLLDNSDVTNNLISGVKKEDKKDDEDDNKKDDNSFIKMENNVSVRPNSKDKEKSSKEEDKPKTKVVSTSSGADKVTNNKSSRSVVTTKIKSN